MRAEPVNTTMKIAGAVVPAILFIAWVSGISYWTAGFSAFTTYSHALAEAGPLPRAMPQFAMVDREGKLFRFEDLKGRYLLVDFMYLQCSSVCGILRSRLDDYYDELGAAIPDRLAIVSVSFDAERDNLFTLGEAWVGAGSRDGWIFSVMAKEDDSGLAPLEALRRFGVVALKNSYGDFNHSAYHFLVNPQGKLVRVIEPGRDAAGVRKNLAEIRELIEAGV